MDSENGFREASFTGADFTGALFRDCDLRRVKIADSWLMDVNVSGEIRNFVVNDVDVTAYVEGELDRRYPERARLRDTGTAAGYRALWATIEDLWAQTVARAERLPEAARHEQVGGEWSFAQTLRHLVFATDAWAGSTILDLPQPYHPLGLPFSGYPAGDAAAIGVDLDADPAYAEVLRARADRVALVRGIVEDIDDAGLERLSGRPPAPGYPEEQRRVGRCLHVIMKEEIEHRRYAERDLSELEIHAT